MIVTSTALIADVRAHIDADEVAPGQWVSDATMLTWINRGVVKLWRKLARSGRIQPLVSTTQGTPVFSFGGEAEQGNDPEPLVVYGVAEVLDNDGRRPLKFAQSGVGTPPYTFMQGETGTPMYWWVQNTGEGAYGLSFYPSTDQGTYEVTWLAKPLRLILGDPGDADGVVNQMYIPAGMEEYPVLYAARMSFARAGAAPPSIQRMLDEFDQELDAAAETFLHSNGPRVINRDHELRGWARRGQDAPITWGTNWWWAP